MYVKGVCAAAGGQVIDSPLLTQQIEAQRLSIKHLKNENNRLKVSASQAHFPNTCTEDLFSFLCLCVFVWTAGRKDACSAGISSSSERAKAGLARGLQAWGVVQRPLPQNRPTTGYSPSDECQCESGGHHREISRSVISTLKNRFQFFL